MSGRHQHPNRVSPLARRHRLFVSGEAKVKPEYGLPEGLNSIHLLSPDEPGFWAHVTSQPEFADGQPDPLDRWSRRVICELADQLGGMALFPFGDSRHPFHLWAIDGMTAMQSPVHLLAHQRMGLWTSYRGAIALPDLAAPWTGQDYCWGACPTPSPAMPCRTACPVGALTENGYDVARCHTYLDTPEGVDCMTHGCAVRRACPLGHAYGRLPEQSAWHMRQFHP